MGILRKIRLSISAEARLLAELAELTGHNQELAERLERHAKLCAYEQMRPHIETLARGERTHLKQLHAILSEHRVWSRLPENPVHEGSNNWERLSLDLELLMRLAHRLLRLSNRWEGINEAVSQRLLALSEEDAVAGTSLRSLVMKLDPQALD